MNQIFRIKINSLFSNNSHIDNKTRQTDFSGEQEKNNITAKKDPLSNYQLRLSAYSNEIGAAISPIPGIGHTLFMLSWVPALMYFGADIYDKYAKGEQSDYSNPSKHEALKQAVFQALASVLLPTVAVISGQKISSYLSRFFDKDKMDVRAKEDILNELKRDLNQDKFHSYKNDINQLLEKNSKTSFYEIETMPQVKKWKKEITESIYHDIIIESETVKRHRENSSIFKKFIGLFMEHKPDCEYVSKIPSKQFDTLVKPYLEKQVSTIFDTRIELQRALNKDGTLNGYAKHINSKILKKAEILLKKNIVNRNIIDKSNFVIRECAVNTLNKTALKLSVIKIIGGFAMLGLLAKPIDYFTEHIIIKKLVNPRFK